MSEIDQLIVHFSKEGAMALNISLGIIMFSVALGLTIEDFKRVLSTPKSVIIGLFTQFALLPFLTLLLVISSNPDPSIALGMFMVAACPGGNISNFMSMIAKANVALSVSLTAIATPLAIVLTPFNFALWAGYYEPTSSLLKTIDISSLEMMKTVFIIMGIPLLLGMWMRHHYTQFAMKIGNSTRILSLLLFATIVITAITLNFSAFWNNLYYVLMIVIIHNFLAFAAGYITAHSFGLKASDKKSLTIETGIQNSGLGLLLIFTFFEGLGGMALVAAWWGIWHIISGLGLAYWWKITTHDS